MQSLDLFYMSGLTLQPVSPPAQVSYFPLRVRTSWGPCRAPWWYMYLGQPCPRKKSWENWGRHMYYSEYLVNTGKWQPVGAARLLPAPSDIDVAVVRCASKTLGLYGVHSGAPQPIPQTVWPLSDSWGVKHWHQCNISANKAMFYQFRVTGVKNFSLHSSPAFITVKWKNAYRVVQQAVTSASKAMAHTSKFPYCTVLLFKII